MPKLGGLTIDWGEELEGLEDVYFIFLKNIQFTFSRTNPLYFAHGALNNRPISHAARNEKWRVRVLISSVK